jgi:NMD protein affecting ribosome stability and mRNA decay
MSTAGNLIEGVEDGVCLDCGKPLDTLMPGLCGPCAALGVVLIALLAGALL